MSSTWYLAPSLNVLRDEIDAAYPHRQKKMDGTIGDAAHAARDSDHNPNARGSVNALDVDEIGIDAWALVACAILDDRTNYVIYEGKIWQRKHGFKPRPYTGPNAHKRHVHISILQTRQAEQDVRPWGYRGRTNSTNNTEKENDMATAKEIAKEILLYPVQANGKTQPLVQHWAESFVSTAAQSVAVGTEAARDKQLAQAAAERDKAILARLDQVLAEVRK